MQVKEINCTRKVLDQWCFRKDQPLVSKGNCCAFWLIDKKSTSLGAAVNFISGAVGGPCHRYVT